MLENLLVTAKLKALEPSSQSSNANKLYYQNKKKQQLFHLS